MKFSSVLPWYQENIPSCKGILLYGNFQGLISFRSKCLQKIYAHFGYKIIFCSSAEEAIEKLQELPGLFETKVSKKCFVLENVTDSFLKKVEIVDVLPKSPHILILCSSKLTSKSKIVTSFQASIHTALLACYDINVAEVSEVCHTVLSRYQIHLDPMSSKYLTNFLTAELENFFSIIETVSLYAENAHLNGNDLKNLLKDFVSSHLETFNQCFFEGDVMALGDLVKTIDPSDWIGLLRPLMQDLTTLLALNIHHVKVPQLRETWTRGIVKFPYPRIALYEKILPLWNLKRCGEALAKLLHLEKTLKSSPAPFASQIEFQLIHLSCQI